MGLGLACLRVLKRLVGTTKRIQSFVYSVAVSCSILHLGWGLSSGINSRAGITGRFIVEVWFMKVGNDGGQCLP